MSSVHVCVQSVRQNIREDMEDRRVTNLSEDRKRDDDLGHLSMDLQFFIFSLLREK